MTKHHANGLSTETRTFIVLAIALACFAILLPKIFYPMFLGPTNTKSKSVSDNGLPSIHPAFRVPLKKSGQIENQKSKSYPDAQFVNLNKENIRFPNGGPAIRPNPMNRHITKSEPESEFTTLYMTISTIIIILMVVYTLIKLFTRKNGNLGYDDESLNEKIYPNLKMDAEYRKYLLQERYDQQGRSLDGLRKTKLNSLIGNESSEISRLKSKLRNTEIELQKLVEKFHNLKSTSAKCACIDCVELMDGNQLEDKNQSSTDQKNETQYEKSNVQSKYSDEQSNEQSNEFDDLPVKRSMNGSMNHVKESKHMNATMIEHMNRHVTKHMNEPTKRTENELISRHFDKYLNESNHQSSPISYLEKEKANDSNQFDFCDLCKCSKESDDSIDLEQDQKFGNLRVDETSYLNVKYKFANNFNPTTNASNHHSTYTNGSNYVDELNFVKSSDFVDKANFIDNSDPELNYLDENKYESNFEPNFEDDTDYVDYHSRYIDRLTRDQFDDFREQSKSLNQEMSELESELFDYHEYSDDYQLDALIDNEMNGMYPSNNENMQMNTHHFNDLSTNISNNVQNDIRTLVQGNHLHQHHNPQKHSQQQFVEQFIRKSDVVDSDYRTDQQVDCSRTQLYDDVGGSNKMRRTDDQTTTQIHQANEQSKEEVYQVDLMTKEFEKIDIQKKSAIRKRKRKNKKRNQQSKNQDN